MNKSISKDSRYWRINFSYLSPELLARVSRWAVWAALIEFLLLRVVIRFGPMLPPSPAVTQGAQVVLLAGTVALNVAVILTTLAVLIIAAQSVTRPIALRGLLIVAAILGLVRVALPHGMTPVLDAVFLLYSVVALAAMVTALARFIGRALPSEEPRGDKLAALQSSAPSMGLAARVLLTVLVLIYAALSYPTLLATAARLGWSSAPGAQAAFHSLAEGLAVLVALMAYVVYRPTPSKLALAGALIVTALLGGFWFARPHLASALTQWTVDFATFLPPWLYLLGLTGFLYTAIALARSSEARSRFAAWGLILIALGGLRWDYTYFSGLGLMGFLLLAESWQV